MVTERDTPHFKKYGVHLIYINCDPSYAENRQLPRDAILVECEMDDTIWFDIVKGYSRSAIFDAYYDLLGGVVKSFSWTKGTIPPKSWDYQNKPKDKKNS
jgi:hypothetical protein